jgi:hypothetical protein
MQIIFKGLWNNEPQDVDANSVGRILESLVSQTTNHPQGFQFGQNCVAQLAKIARQTGGDFNKNFERQARTMLERYASGLGLNTAGRSFPDIQRDDTQERILMIGLVQGGSQLGRILTPQHAWQRCCGLGVHLLATTFVGYPEHLGRCVGRDDAQAHAEQIVNWSLARNSIECAKSGLDVFEQLATTRACLAHNPELVRAIDNGVYRAAYEVVEKHGQYYVDVIGTLVGATKNSHIAQSLRNGCEDATNARRLQLDRERASLVVLQNVQTAEA